MAPFEALYGRRCRLPIGWFEPDDARLYGNNLVKDALENKKLIKERLRTTQSHVLDYSTVQLDESLGYEEEPFAIFDKHIHQLRSKKISAVKVQWRDQPVKEDTCETKEVMQSRYPHLFSTPGMILDLFEDEYLLKR
ncbi:uncharacterized protein [Nicotiana tomentosiformis]|uniref:uncharacterized protein n=1 Tax=Nicotiana tomentosiformis TaxID=4098 RepID=UPI00388C6824